MTIEAGNSGFDSSALREYVGRTVILGMKNEPEEVFAEGRFDLSTTTSAFPLRIAQAVTDSSRRILCESLRAGNLTRRFLFSRMSPRNDCNVNMTRKMNEIIKALIEMCAESFTTAAEHRPSLFGARADLRRLLKLRYPADFCAEDFEQALMRRIQSRLAHLEDEAREETAPIPKTP